MKKIIPFSLLLLFFVSACGDDKDEFFFFEPSYIEADWEEGVTGPPAVRFDFDTPDFIGDICATDTVDLFNFGPEFAGLNILNQCPGETVTYALCVAPGSPTQPAGGLQFCTEDPFLTPLNQLTFVTVPFDDIGVFIDSTETLFLNVYWCSQSQALTGPPVTPSLECI